MKQKITVKFPPCHLESEDEVESIEFVVQDGYAILLKDATRFVLLDHFAKFKVGDAIRMFNVDSFLRLGIPMHCFTFKRSAKLCFEMIWNFVWCTLFAPFYWSGMLLPAVDKEYKRYYTSTGKIVALSEVTD